MRAGEPSDKSPRVAVVIVAAGRGQRAGAGGGPKQYRKIGGRTVISRTLDAFIGHEDIGAVVVVIHTDDHAMMKIAIGDRHDRVHVTEGGATRQDSVLCGLRVLEDDAPDVVLIHDAARPFVDDDTIARTIAAVTDQNGALPALVVADTLKRGDEDGMVAGTISRAGLYAAQTPQGFPFAAILEAHRRAARSSRTDFTDDASVAEWAGLPVRLVSGSAENVKLTWANDVDAADRRLSLEQARFPDVRTGNGYDVHAFESGDHVVLCGVSIPHDRKLLGHSDADVGLHALTDALLATCGAGDIGAHFPPSDPQWRGAASRLFVERAVSIIRSHGGRIANADITLICEAPHIGAHRVAMTAAIAAMLGIDKIRVSVKATTNERLGFIGREEGIAAIATATVVFPGELPA